MLLTSQACLPHSLQSAPPDNNTPIGPAAVSSLRYATYQLSRASRVLHHNHATHLYLRRAPPCVSPHHSISPSSPPSIASPRPIPSFQLFPASGRNKGVGPPFVCLSSQARPHRHLLSAASDDSPRRALRRPGWAHRNSRATLRQASSSIAPLQPCSGPLGRRIPPSCSGTHAYREPRVTIAGSLPSLSGKEPLIIIVQGPAPLASYDTYTIEHTSF